MSPGASFKLVRGRGTEGVPGAPSNSDRSSHLTALIASPGGLGSGCGGRDAGRPRTGWWRPWAHVALEVPLAISPRFASFRVSSAAGIPMEKTFPYTNTAGTEFMARVRDRPQLKQGAGGWCCDWRYAVHTEWVEPPTPLPVPATATIEAAIEAAKRFMDRLWESGATRVRDRPPVDPSTPPRA
jgi:hypothetical protein